MDLDAVLSDAELTRAPIQEAATDEKPSIEVDEPFKEPAESSSAKESEAQPETQAERDDKGRFAKKEDQKPEPMVPLSALLAERAKRKEAPQEKPKTDIFENPDKAFEERISEATAPLKAQLFNMSLSYAKRAHTDFEEAAKAFADATEKDARLLDQLRAHEDPGEFIYNVGLQLKELSDVGGDFGKYREKIRSEAAKEMDSLKARLAALEAENQTLKARQDKVSKVPQSLNSETSSTVKGADFSGPTPLKNILNA